MPTFPILKEGFPYIIYLVIISSIAFFLNIYLSSVFIILLLFVVFFFRNPRRNILKDSNKILSPADGKIMEISKIYESDYLKSDAIKISIFLSIFNVHANKSPIDGIVEYTNYRPGKYLPAFKSHASEINERNTIGIQGDGIKVLVNQITGFIARRIVCWVKQDNKVYQGENYGLIKFGSCTELIVPQNVTILVKPGDNLRGGISIIGVINSEI